MADAHKALLRAFTAAPAEIHPFEIEEARWRPWASATFEGARHSVRLRFGGEAPARRAALFTSWASEHEFALRGHLVADIASEPAAEGNAWLLSIEALTIAEA